MGLAFLANLNRLAVFVGLNANLPWIIVPWYAGTTMVAAAALGVGLPPTFRGELSGAVRSNVYARVLGAGGRAAAPVSRAVPYRPNHRCGGGRTGDVSGRIRDADAVNRREQV